MKVFFEIVDFLVDKPSYLGYSLFAVGNEPDRKEKKQLTRRKTMTTEARFLHSQKMAEAVELGAQVKEVWDNGESGDSRTVIVEFANGNGVYVIDNADAHWGDYAFGDAVEKFQSGEIELSPITRFERDGDSITSFNV